MIIRQAALFCMLLVACCIASFSFISWWPVSLLSILISLTICISVFLALALFLSCPNICPLIYSAFLHSRPSSPLSSLRGQKTKVRGWVRQITMEIEEKKKKKKESERVSALRAQVLMLTSSLPFFRVQYQQSTIRAQLLIFLPSLLEHAHLQTCSFSAFCHNSFCEFHEF